MIANLSGIALVVAITAVAGGIAYIGDRVGHQVGRKRLTLFGLRPKYTSTIVAVATGMLIALSVTSVALIGSNQVRTAFFRLGQINARINDLQAQAINTQKDLDKTRDSQFVVSIGYPIGNTVLTTRLSLPDAVVLAQLSAFFDNTVRAANAQFARPPYDLKPYRKKSSDPEIQALLREQLVSNRATLPADAPVLFLPLVAQNLFKGDVISFRLAPYSDVRMAAAGEVLASLDVQGGQASDSLILPYQRLTAAAVAELEKRGIPAVFAINVQPSNNVQEVLNQLSRLRGHFRLIAKAGLDLYPHSGAVLLDYSLEPPHISKGAKAVIDNVCQALGSSNVQYKLDSNPNPPVECPSINAPAIVADEWHNLARPAGATCAVRIPLQSQFAITELSLPHALASIYIEATALLTSIGT